MRLNTILVDDERRSRESLKYLLEKYCNDIEIIGQAGSVKEAKSLIQSENPDLVFLDIKMQDGTGFDLLDQISNLTFQVIFTTAFDEYAIQAFKFSAIDYLLKPIDIEELNQAVEKAKTVKSNVWTHAQLQQLLTHVTQFDQKDPIITISTETSYEFLKVLDIIRVGAEGAYARFYMKSKKQYLTSKLLKEYEALLRNHGFFRIHHSHLVNLREVERFIKTDGHVVLRDGSKIPVSRRRKEEFVKSLMST